ncbi:MAG: hypothetical protein H7Z42_08390 [Roseiflexaceae bacterium]|nr:hypothetical protein [Roseiflexaceae bacterium]
MFNVRPVVWHFVWWALLAPLLLVELAALHTFQESLALRDPERSRVAFAQVTAQRQDQRNPIARYRFQVPGDATWYSASDIAGRRDLWTPLTSAAAAAARRSNQIEVRYLPDNPWANQPLGRAGNPLVDSFAFWILFALVDLLWLTETFLIGRNYLRCLHAAERRESLSMRFWQARS